MIKASHRIGIGFGTTSGVITTLGVIVGLNSALDSRFLVVGGIITIAVADAFSDALAIHVSQETEESKSSSEIWESALATFFTKLVLALSFLIPVFIFSSVGAIWASLIWGLLIICLMSFFIARHRRVSPLRVILEHLAISIVVVIIARFVGVMVSSYLVSPYSI
ncbi:MAG: hypothetical protein OEV37_01905 [Candidatus Berkelbacteria bacterium]|nr:hypothetical protein [Candidatus Berkelbacteria bacterium]